MSAERRRLSLALLLSLLIHTLLLSLSFGGLGSGLPGFVFPWRERRIEAPDLRVLLVPARATAAEPTVKSPTLVAEPLQQPLIERIVVNVPVPTPTVSSAPTPGLTAVAITPEAKATAQAAPEPDIATAAVPSAVATKTASRAEGPSDAAPTPIPVPEVIAVERSSEAAFVVPPPQPATAVNAVAPGAPSAQIAMQAARDAGEVAQKRTEPEVRVEAAQLEAARIEAARLETERLKTERQEAARLAAANVEAQRQELTRQETARIEAAQLDAQRREAARLAAAKLEAQRQEAARVVAARVEAARLESERQDEVRQAAVQATAGKEAARIQAEKEEDARRAARREAMGRQLNEEAAANAARSSATLPLSLSTARRGRLWGRTDANVELVEYVEAWGRKIQFNTSVDTVREVAKRPHTNPMVTVAIRGDGSVESVTFVLSSGVTEVDEAIRRIVQSLVPYPAFPPGLAREFDVIEVRRTWHFDTAVRLY